MKAALLCLLGLWLAAAAGASGAQEFGRLFFTPEQRARMDQLRERRHGVRPDA